jgi:tetratricopeptide (TPR) repeat protein
MTQNAAADRVAELAKAIADLEQNQFPRVMARCAALLVHDPEDVEAQLLCGLAAGARGYTEYASRLLHRAGLARGAAEHPCRDLAVILRRIGKSELIEPQFRAALHLAADDAGLLHAFADFLYDSGRFSEAVPLLIEARCRRPDFMPARNLLALALAAMGDIDAAIGELRAAVKQDAFRAGTWANLGLLLKDHGHFNDALVAYDTALTLAPDDAQIRVNRVVALLRAGRWTEAWPDYEWRLTLADHATRQPNLLPALSTLPDLVGRTILAVHEDGFGDTLHFARYLPLLAERGARVVVSAPAALVQVMRTIPGVQSVCDQDDVPMRYDFYCPFFSLPRAFETTPDTIPAPIPYLLADPSLVDAWRSKLPHGVLRVGLVWAGQARPTLPGFEILDGRRSMVLAMLAPLVKAASGVVFVSLQHGKEAVQARSPPDGMTLIDPMPAVTDFADTAAIIANLDLVISVDTAVVHLAGALGKPVFLLDRYDHCWRWLSGRADSPWYPAMRIFRQQRIGDWTQVLRQVAAALSEFAATRPHAAGRPGIRSVSIS